MRIVPSGSFKTNIMDESALIVVSSCRVLLSKSTPPIDQRLKNCYPYIYNMILCDLYADQSYMVWYVSMELSSTIHKVCSAPSIQLGLGCAVGRSKSLLKIRSNLSTILLMEYCCM